MHFEHHSDKFEFLFLLPLLFFGWVTLLAELADIGLMPWSILSVLGYSENTEPIYSQSSFPRDSRVKRAVLHALTVILIPIQTLLSGAMTIFCLILPMYSARAIAAFFTLELHLSSWIFNGLTVVLIWVFFYYLFFVFPETLMMSLGLQSFNLYQFLKERLVSRAICQ